MNTNIECPRAGQGLVLPFDSGLAGASAAYFDGRDYALELLAYVATVQSLQGYSAEQQANMARAALCGFLAPLLPMLADALALFAADARAGVLAGLIDDLAHGAPLALDLAALDKES